MGAPVSKKVLLDALRKDAGTTEHADQLELILTWLDWLELIRIDGDSVSLAPQPSTVDVNPADDLTGDQGVEDNEGETPGGSGRGDAERATEQVASHAADSPANGRPIVSLSFNVSLTADDAARLNQEQLEAVLGLIEKLRP